MLDWLNGKIVEVETLIKAVVALGAMAVIGLTYWRARALVPTITAAVLAGGVVWAVSNVSWFETKVGEETGAPAPVTFTVTALPVAVDAPVVVPAR